MNRTATRTIALLCRAEAEIALLQRARPIGLAREVDRLIRSWEAQTPSAPAWRYARPPDFDQLRRCLASIVERAPDLDADGCWLAGRAQELLLEARLVQAVGTTEFERLARERFPLPSGKFAARVEALSRRWVELSASRLCTEPTYRSEDRRSRQSLWSILSARLGALRTGVRIELDRKLVAIAACGEDFIVIRAGAELTERAARRIAEHEIVGHLLPRLASRGRTDILRCGCPGSVEDEEGRALLIERRLGLMDVWRGAELGARHLCCVSLRQGASFVESVRALKQLGVPTELALRSAVRAYRGGGLGREVIYLPAMLRVGAAFDSCAALEGWFELGRASLEYAMARQGRLHAVQTSISTHTGT